MSALSKALFAAAGAAATVVVVAVFMPVSEEDAAFLLGGHGASSIDGPAIGKMYQIKEGRIKGQSLCHKNFDKNQITEQTITHYFYNTAAYAYHSISNFKLKDTPFSMSWETTVKFADNLKGQIDGSCWKNVDNVLKAGGIVCDIRTVYVDITNPNVVFAVKLTDTCLVWCKNPDSNKSCDGVPKQDLQPHWLTRFKKSIGIIGVLRT